MQIAITGAAGFVGTALRARFAGLGGQVHGYDLAGRGTVLHWDVGSGPLTRPPDVDVVVHAAAHLAPTARFAEAWRVNVDGTRHVAESFPHARFVHISSGSVYDPWHAQVDAREDEAPAPGSIRWSNAYGRTKSEAEHWLAEHRPDAVRLRPHAIYGDGDPTLAPRVRGAVRRGRLPIPGDGTQRHSITWVENLVDACLLAMRDDVPGGAYNVTDAEPVLLADALIAMAARPDFPRPRIRPLPLGPLVPLAHLSEAVARLRGVEPRFSVYTVEHLARERTFDITKAREILGYAPSVGPVPQIRDVR